VRVQAHYVSDALAGVLLGVIVVLAAAVVVSRAVELFGPRWDA
jgi:membrane-associated phospholipid phosphatase